MRPTTRDNIIYLTIGLSIAALVTVDFFYADSHGRQMWLPSRFAFRTVSYMGLLAYFVARETSKAKATIFQASLCVLIASIIHLGIAYGFRSVFAGSFSFSLYLLAILECFLIVQLMVQAIHHVRSRSPHAS